MDALLLRGSWSPPAAASPLLRASSWSPPGAVAAVSNRARPVRRAVHANPGRRDMYVSPVKVQARTFRSHCNKKGADQYPEPEPEREDVVDEPDSAGRSEKLGIALCEHLRNNREAFRAAMGVHVAQDMFLKEKDQITYYKMNMPSSGFDILNVNAILLAQNVCSEVQTALDLASQVMDIARGSLSTTEFSENTINQMVMMRTTTFLKIAEDAYHKRVEMATIISFLGALRGLGAVCHFLVEGAVRKLEDGPLKDSIRCSIDEQTQEFGKKVTNLKEKIMAVTPISAYKIVTDILSDGIMHARLYISQLVECRKAALPHIKVTNKAV